MKKELEQKAFEIIKNKVLKVEDGCLILRDNIEENLTDEDKEILEKTL